LRLALALARVLFGWHTISLRLALALARIGRRGSRPLHLSAATLLQLGGQRAHGMRWSCSTLEVVVLDLPLCTRHEGASESKAGSGF